MHYDIIIIGAGAAGLMCAHYASHNNKSICVLEHNKQVGRKILISGGGRCNFTNLIVEPKDFYCENPHFVKSALSRFSPWDFISMIEEDEIPYEERKHGQLFCKRSAKDINNLLLKRTNKENIDIKLSQTDLKVKDYGEGFEVTNENLTLTCDKLVVATGGLSVPSIGATGFGHQLAKEYGHKILPPMPALVPFKVPQFGELSGISLEIKISCKNGYSVLEDLLLTHRGLSGPATLKASLFWNPGEAVEIDWLPHHKLNQIMTDSLGSVRIEKLLKKYLPNKLADWLISQTGINGQISLGSLKKVDQFKLEQIIHSMKVIPETTEGFRKAEATRGGVDTNKISSKTMESQLRSGLFFIGEVLDVTGNLGGFNFQWAWASGHAAGKALA